MGIHGTALNDGQLAEFISALTKAGVLVANELGIKQAQHWSKNGNQLKEELLSALREKTVQVTSCSPLLRKIATVAIKACKGKRTFVSAKELFRAYFDPDFEKYETNKPGKPTGHTETDIFDLVENATSTQIFTNPESMHQSQDQAINFIEDHRELLSKEGATLFLIRVEVEENGEKKDKFFVVYVHVYSGGTLDARVYHLAYGRVWLARCRYRVVVPATAT